jgi:hypothetical protein
MNLVLRFLGVELLARAAGRLPAPMARVATAALLVVVNLLPVWAVLDRRAGMGDVFLVYWIENVVVWLCGIVRVATAEGIDTAGGVTDRRTGLAPFFALHYGIFTLVHGVFAIVMAVLVGLVGGLGQVLLLALLIAVSHVVSLGFTGSATASGWSSGRPRPLSRRTRGCWCSTSGSSSDSPSPVARARSTTTPRCTRWRSCAA